MTTTIQSPRVLSIGWSCASCGELITGIEVGWLEWLAGADEHGTTRLKGLRMVHTCCRYDDRSEFRKDQSLVEGLPLARFVGSDGLMLLLSLIAEGEMPRAELIEIVKRLHIPGYELTRELFADAIRGGAVAPIIGEGFYMQSEIREVLTWAVKSVTPHEQAL